MKQILTIVIIISSAILTYKVFYYSIWPDLSNLDFSSTKSVTVKTRNISTLPANQSSTLRIGVKTKLVPIEKLSLIAINDTLSNLIVPTKVTQLPSDSFLSRIIQVIKGSEDFVYLDRFYSEHNLSYAKLDLESQLISSLSEHGPRITAPSALGVNRVTWHRTWYREMYLTKKTGHPGDFPALAKQIAKIRHFANQTGHSIAAVRYHSYQSFCSLANLGNPSVLPLPVMLTFKLNPVFGHFAVDIPSKTCIRSVGYERARSFCQSPIDLTIQLRRCKLRQKDVLQVLEHPKILLLLVNDMSAIPHRKILSLPLGIRPGNALALWKQLHDFQLGVKNTPARSLLLAISNGFTGYHDKVLSYFSKQFHISATFDYETSQELIHSAGIPDYVEKLLSSKFTLCPAGLHRLDSYRIWESLVMGSIPIVEASSFGPTLERSFSLLPVLVVTDFLKLTKDVLDSAYNCFRSHAMHWRFEMLTQKYWDEMILTALKSGSIEHISKDHPPFNPYCNFMLFNSTAKRWQ